MKGQVCIITQKIGSTDSVLSTAMAIENELY